VTDPITSTANPRIKELVRLRSRRARDATGTFVVEGYREMRRALDAGVRLRAVFACPELYLGSNEPDLVAGAAAAGAEIVQVAPDPFRKASYRDRPEGVLAVADQFSTDIDRLPLDGNRLILIAESIEKPGNLGTMMRTAEGAGLDGVIVADPTTDPFNPNVVRASIGTLFSLPLAVADTETTIDALRSAGVQIVATTPEGAVAHHEVDFTPASAIVVGSEQYGLSDPWLEAADVTTVIPMPGSVDSLNAAMAAGIVIFEALRQRSA
jgi:TrmH family RNA methyltransferase